MKKIKVIILFCLLFFSTFLYLDNKSYYYGFGKGFLSSKLPDYIRPYYSGTDLGNTGFSFVEKDIDLDIIDNLHPVYLLDNRKIMIKRFLGYNFDEKTVTVKIMDVFNQKRYIKIHEAISDKKNMEFIFEEVKFIQKDLKYIDLDKSLSYFKRFNIVKNIVFIILCLLCIYLFKLVYKEQKAR